MDCKELFFNAIKKDMEMTLATSDGKSVTMRTVSPVYYNGNILFLHQPILKNTVSSK